MVANGTDVNKLALLPFLFFGGLVAILCLGINFLSIILHLTPNKSHIRNGLTSGDKVLRSYSERNDPFFSVVALLKYVLTRQI